MNQLITINKRAIDRSINHSVSQSIILPIDQSARIYSRSAHATEHHELRVFRAGIAYFISPLTKKEYQNAFYGS